VWCVDADDDPVARLDTTQRTVLLGGLLPAAAGVVRSISALKAFDLGLNAELRLVRGRTVRIGNAAQTLHPVAGQGLNLGLRDAYALVQALRGAGSVDARLRRLEAARVLDRWSAIATTDLLARSFTWRGPVVSALRSAGLGLLELAPPLRSRLARQMMFGLR
jgi:2-octaprenyl-6-methoxyphenol hydroxylase